MDLPFFYTHNPWQYYYPFPYPLSHQQRSRFPSVVRGRIFEDDPSQRQPTTITTTRPQSNWNPTGNHHQTRNRNHSSSRNATNHDRITRHHQPTIAPSHHLTMASTRLPTRLPTRNLTSMPMPSLSISFSRVARDLSSTLDEALDYFRPLYHEFGDETRDIRAYTDQAVVDLVWGRKVRGHQSRGGGGDVCGGGGVDVNSQEDEGVLEYEKEDGREVQAESETSRDFRDHQAAVYNRCEDLLGAVLPPSVLARQWRQRRQQQQRTSANSDGSERIFTRTDDYDDGAAAAGRGGGRRGGLEAAALVAKMARCREDLFPALRRMGSQWTVLGMAIREMEVLRANLETYREVWDGSGHGSGNEGDA